MCLVVEISKKEVPPPDSRCSFDGDSSSSHFSFLHHLHFPHAHAQISRIVRDFNYFHGKGAVGNLLAQNGAIPSGRSINDAASGRSPNANALVYPLPWDAHPPRNKVLKPYTRKLYYMYTCHKSHERKEEGINKLGPIFLSHTHIHTPFHAHMHACNVSFFFLLHHRSPGTTSDYKGTALSDPLNAALLPCSPM